MAGRIQKLIAIGGSSLLTYYGISYYLEKKPVEAIQNEQNCDYTQQQIFKSTRSLPTRCELLKSLKETPEFDILVIGGGATGCGVALDAATRGLNTALLEMDDFASGTSSRSTKLIHGGVRYLQKAILRFDREQYRMVKDALQERANLLHIAPHLASSLPIMLPLYRWWQVPYYWFGIKVYDFVAGNRRLDSSYYLSRSKALSLFPMLKKEKLFGAIVYYDGQHNDARMNLSIALSAIKHGATLVNHVMVTGLTKMKNCDDEDQICGVHCVDILTGEEFDVRAKTVINATGPFIDRIRHMDDPLKSCICQPSSGVHITLPEYYSPTNMGLLDPSTRDGRVIFFLPWEKHTIAGTTDHPTEVTHHPAPTEEDIAFILSEIKSYLSEDIMVRRGDVLSAWSGIRPLVLDPNKTDTQSIARNHIIEISKTGLLTIAGGKWTTYRLMAEETIDAAIKSNSDLNFASECKTKGFLLEGAHNWSPTLFIRLVQDYGLESEVAQHLSNSYGDKCIEVAKMASLTGKKWPVIGCRLHPLFPYIEAEVRYAIKEYACTAVDVIGRRFRLSFLNNEATLDILPRIIAIMAEELKWSKQEQKKQLEQAMEYLNIEMGHNVNRLSRQDVCESLTEEEICTFKKKFNALDKGGKGYISVLDLSQSLKESGEHISESKLHEILNEVDLNKNGFIELDEFMELMSAIKTGVISQSRLARLADIVNERKSCKITAERSGGGV